MVDVIKIFLTCGLVLGEAGSRSWSMVTVNMTDVLHTYETLTRQSTEIPMPSHGIPDNSTRLRNLSAANWQNFTNSNTFNKSANSHFDTTSATEMFNLTDAILDRKWTSKSKFMERISAKKSSETFTPTKTTKILDLNVATTNFDSSIDGNNNNASTVTSIITGVTFVKVQINTELMEKRTVNDKQTNLRPNSYQSSPNMTAVQTNNAVTVFDSNISSNRLGNVNDSRVSVLELSETQVPSTAVVETNGELVRHTGTTPEHSAYNYSALLPIVENDQPIVKSSSPRSRQPYVEPTMGTIMSKGLTSNSIINLTTQAPVVHSDNSSDSSLDSHSSTTHTIASLQLASNVTMTASRNTALNNRSFVISEELVRVSTVESSNVSLTELEEPGVTATIRLDATPNQPQHSQTVFGKYNMHSIFGREKLLVLIPVLSGMAGAMVTVFIAYILRDCPTRMCPTRHRKISHGRRNSDKTLLVYDMSDQEAVE